VLPGLRDAGIVPHPITLPGLDGGATSDVTLDHQVGAVAELTDSLEGDVLLVGHSGGGVVVQGVVDRRHDRVRRVVYVDTVPLRNGTRLRPDAASDIVLPAWDELAAEGNTIDGIAAADLEMFRARAVAHPVGAAAAPVEVTQPERLDVPVSVICCSLTSTELVRMVEEGHIPSELLDVHDVRYVDLPTGHWPMLSRPIDLAEAIAAEICTATPK
jgi:pimeloyl-ACP methyl ester carboxylesterase